MITVRTRQRWILASIVISCMMTSCNSADQKTEVVSTKYSEPHRPQIHFSPPEKWMNDPNGMVYFKDTYHLFYQYYPDSTVWGPMHWGHASSKDLMHWEHQPIALYPDSLGYIFSGSAVVDSQNTSGFGKDGKIPLVAIFTHHDAEDEKKGIITYQNQSLAYSLDDGKTWTKYSGNPVLKNPGIKDFRDPKVMWHAETKKWIMALAILDRIGFYSSSNLKDWTKESELGQNFGAHGGVWECPDLFALDHEGKKVWVLLVSINPGGPNGGSATQYFTGQFDGKTFTPFHTDIQWIDYGPDDYAGVTFFNTGSRKIFIGWMSNWLYGQKVPTEKWRSAMTIPRELALDKVGDKYFLKSTPVKELDALQEEPKTRENISATNYVFNADSGMYIPSRIKILLPAKDFMITLSNDHGQKLLINYEHAARKFMVDRTAAGKADFEKEFGIRHESPRISMSDSIQLELILDKSSLEMFADDGLTVMTEIFFPQADYNKIQVEAGNGIVIPE